MLRLVVGRYRAAYADLPREVWVLAAAMLVNRSGTMVLPFLTLYLTEVHDVGEGAAGQMISIYGLGAIAGAYGGGRLAEWLGAVRLQTICFFLAAPAFLLIPRMNSYAGIAVCVLYFSVVAEAIRPANATAIAKVTSPALRTRAFALQRLASNLGFSIGPAVGGLLAKYNFVWLFYVDAATTCLAGVLMWHSFRMARLPGETHLPMHQRSTASPLADRQFVAFLGLLLASMIAFFQFIATYPLYLRDHYGLDKPAIGMLFAVNTLVIVAFEMLLIDSAKSWPLLRTIAWGSFLGCAGFGILPFGTSFGFAALAMLVLTAGEMLSAPLTAGYVANRSPAGSEGRYLGWQAVTISLAAVLGPAIGSVVYTYDRHLVWYGCLAVGVGVLIGFLWLAAREPRIVADDSGETLDYAVPPQDVATEAYAEGS